MAQKIAWLKKGAPFFLDEVENGVFFSVTALRYLENPGYSEYEYDLETGKLLIGHDIAETPNRSVSILLKSEKEGHEAILEAINECLKIAAVSSHDYVTLEPFGEELGRLIHHDGKTKFMEIRPRFFNKID